MSVSAAPSNGGGFGIFPPPLSFPFTFPHPTTVSVSVTSFSVVIQESVTVSISSTTASTTQSTTESTTSYITVSTTLHTTFSTQGPTITTVPTASLAAEDSILKSSASLTKTNTIIIGVLGGAVLLIIFLLVILLCLFVRRRRHDRENDSPPFTSLAPQAAPAFLQTTTQSAPALPQQLGTSLSIGPRSAGYVPQAFTSYPPNRPSRPLTAPTSQATQPIPAINIQPNTPSVFARDDSSPISPILQPSAARMPLYHEALQEEAEDVRARRETEDARRLGVPVIERENRRSQSASVSSIGSEMGFEDNGNGESDREREREDRQRRQERGERALHSTRASSGVFPES